MIRRTLGGDRLGTGKKMQVEMHGYERSNHRPGKVFRSTMSAGTLVPFYVEVGLPGDTFDFDLQCEVLTLPTIGPLYGSFKVQLDMFLIPMRLYNSKLHNNALEVGLDMSKIKIPQMLLTALPTPEGTTDIDNSQINPSCILKYLGISGIGIVQGETSQDRYFNAMGLLSYWDIYKNYYSNKQEEVGAVIFNGALVSSPQTVTNITITDTNGNSRFLVQAPAVNPLPIGLSDTLQATYTGATPDPKQLMINLEDGRSVSMYDLCSGVIVDTGSVLSGTYNAITWGATGVVNWNYMTNAQPVEVAPSVFTFPLTNIDAMRSNILAWDNTTDPFVIDENSVSPYGLLNLLVDGHSPLLNSQEGLGIKTYNSDLFNNWLRDEYVNYVNTISAVSTTGDSFTIDQLNLSKKVYDLLNRVMVSGGTYNDWIETVYAVEAFRTAETPMYMGGMIKELVFQEVVSQALTEGQPLGTLAGRGKLAQGQKGGHVIMKITEPSIMMGIVSITPRIDYSQGNAWHVHLQTFDDLHKPALDEIGFQDLITEQMAWWDTTNNTVAWLQKSAGKQPAWINYMTDVNRTYGKFAIASDQMFMTLNRRYEYEEGTGIVDLTTYIDPTKFNFIFADASLDAQNFWVQIGMDINARRKMSAKIMPNL